MTDNPSEPLPPTEVEPDDAIALPDVPDLEEDIADETVPLEPMLDEDLDLDTPMGVDEPTPPPVNVTVNLNGSYEHIGWLMVVTSLAWFVLGILVGAAVAYTVLK